MKEEYNELNDIILKRDAGNSTRKKMLISVGALVLVAIVIIVIMGRMSDSAPMQPGMMPPPDEPALSLPPSPAETAVPATPAVSDVPAASAPETQPEQSASENAPETAPSDQNDIVAVDREPETAAPKQSAAKPAAKPVAPAVTTKTPAPAASPAPGDVYVQVGSFSRYKPNKAFLNNIKRSGYAYTFYRVTADGAVNNKVLVGPFKSRSDAKAHLTDIRRNIESGAFIYTIKP